MANRTRAALAVASVHAAGVASAFSEALASSGHDTHTRRSRGAAQAGHAWSHRICDHPVTTEGGPRHHHDV